MSTTRKAITFLVLTFLISWGVTISAWTLHLNGNPIATFLTLVVMMAGPAIAAFTCALLFEKGRRIDALGLRFTINIWWLWAWLIPFALAGISVAATVLLGGRYFVDPAQQTLALSEGHLPPEKMAQLRALAPMLNLIAPLQVSDRQHHQRRRAHLH